MASGVFYHSWKHQLDVQMQEKSTLGSLASETQAAQRTPGSNPRQRRPCTNSPLQAQYNVAELESHKTLFITQFKTHNTETLLYP